MNILTIGYLCKNCKGPLEIETNNVTQGYFAACTHCDEDFMKLECLPTQVGTVYSCTSILADRNIDSECLMPTLITSLLPIEPKLAALIGLIERHNGFIPIEEMACLQNDTWLHRFAHDDVACGFEVDSNKFYYHENTASLNLQEIEAVNTLSEVVPFFVYSAEEFFSEFYDDSAFGLNLTKYQKMLSLNNPDLLLLLTGMKVAKEQGLSSEHALLFINEEFKKLNPLLSTSV